MTIRLALALMLVVSCAALAQDADKPSMSNEEVNRASSVELLGRRLFEHDKAAALATDQLSAIGLRSDKRVKGWITEPTAGGVKVTVVGIDQGSDPVALYVSEIDNSGASVKAPIKYSVPLPLSDKQSALFRARSDALASKFEPCSKSYNTVALATDSGISVYLIPGTTKENLVPIGGTYRFDYDAEGEKQLATRAYTKSCIALQKDPKSAGMMITHLLDDFPTEVHVYWSLWANSPMYVGIVQTKNLWSINDGKLRLVVRGK